MHTRDIGSPQARAAKNHSRFRDFNERVRDDNSEFNGVVILDDWLCECLNAMCSEHLRVSPEEYDSVRADGVRFLVAPDEAHVFPRVERLVEQQARYWVVEEMER